MSQQMYIDVANVVTKLRMYPYFDLAHYILISIAVREDSDSTASSTTSTITVNGNNNTNNDINDKSSKAKTLIHQQTSPPAGSDQLATLFSCRHPLSSWVSTMLLCFASSLMVNFLLGEPVITPFKDHRNIAIATAVWYLVNFSPFDIVYKLCKLLPMYLIICIMVEIRRAHMVYHGVLVTKKLYPRAYFVIVLVGTIKGCGGCFMRNICRLVRGIWIPDTSEILQPTFVTKASLFASVMFLCERLQLINASHPVIYLGIVIFFIYFRISSVLLGAHDPFVPLENLFCNIFMGGHQVIARQLVRED
ncbi:unnamed protein product [Candidula unifasciata]|uniref:Uncharacterized protein n=1 Tax=Candidula unifasciata TaxID=100452 RepID=A0A8S3YHE0_9EUPU|nr:unnamed protein product [Candidula unifasciata]